MSDDEATLYAATCARVPKYVRYNSELASTYDDYDALPTHLKLMPLPEYLDYMKPGKVVAPGVDVLFDVEGYARSELFMSIYVRTAHDYADFFPLIKIGLEGPLIDAIPLPAGIGTARPKGTMHGKGAFRLLMTYLERELPKRGFKGIFLEQVHNELLQSVALRYGFERLNEPSPICFIKRFAA